MIVAGNGLYGRCDHVPGVGCVATEFFHVYFIPVLPIGSMAVSLDAVGLGWSGAHLPLSVKSLLLAWSRTACVLMAFVTGTWIFMAEAPLEVRVAAGALTAGAIGLLLALAYVPWIRRASYARAREVAKALKVSERDHAILDHAYGRLDDQELEDELARIDDAAFEASALARQQAPARRAEAEARRVAREEQALVDQRAREERRKAREAADPEQAARLRALRTKRRVDRLS